MKRAGRHLVCLSLAAVCAVAASGCGNDVPAGAVAKVGDTVITKEQFDHAYARAAQTQAQQGGPAVAPDPPRYKKCVASLNKAVARMENRPQVYELEASCKQHYERLKTQAMQSLIQSQWVLQEAEDRDLTVTGAAVRKEFEEQKKASFPKEKDYRKFLKASGSSEQDILFRIKLGELQSKLTVAIQKDQEKVSDEDVEEYYEKNKKRFDQPEQRDINVVLTKTEAKAEQAKKELDGGASFKSVAKEYSIDQVSTAKGGKLSAVAPGQQEKALDEAVFAAKKGELEGPVKTRFGWYVFTVTKITPGKESLTAASKASIKQLLATQKQQAAIDTFIKDFEKKWKDETDCADDFIVDMCSNAPKGDTSTESASGGAPTAPGASAPPAAPGAPGAPAAPAAPAQPAP
jgi:foldase protein PrsA